MTIDIGRNTSFNDRLILEQKRKIADKVRMRFARFGDDVLSAVLSFALQPKRMVFLLQRLEIMSNIYNFEAQLDAVSAYVSQNGAVRFMCMLYPDKWKDQNFVAPALPGSAPSESAPGMYSGHERRSGTDRRKHSSRRNDVSAVSRNKRFGGDRRKEKRGRRKSD